MVYFKIVILQTLGYHKLQKQPREGLIHAIGRTGLDREGTVCNRDRGSKSRMWPVENIHIER